MENSFLNNPYCIWIAPAEGLFLRRVLFERYNKSARPFDRINMSEDEVYYFLNFRIDEKGGIV